MNTKKLITAALGLFLIAPSALQAASAYETEVEWGVNFRSQPSTKATVHRMLKKGEDVHVVQKVNRYWLKIETKDGKIGYISANPKYTTYNGAAPVSPTTPANPAVPGSNAASKADRIISLSKSLMGKVTYDFGTRNPSKMIFDCSSFVEYVFEKNGVELPWGTKTLKYKGQAVSKSNLQKGDLVFFSASGSSIDHVGIYIGGGQFIHNTPSKNGLSINDLNTGFWDKNYESARRVL